MDAEPLERRLDPLEHDRNGVARKRRELDDVVALVAVLGRLLAAPYSLDGRLEALHLRTGVVVVVLALDVVPGEREEPCDRVTVGAVPRRRDRDRPGRVRRDHLDLDPLALRSRAGSERVSGTDHLANAVREPGVREPEIDEPWACRFGALGKALLDDASGDLVGDLARWSLLQSSQLQRDIGRVVAVLGVARAFERDRERRRPL